MSTITLNEASRIAEQYPMFYRRDRERYALFSYHWQDMNTFRECPKARELRGIVFDVETGEVVSRPFPKFFNYGELGCEIHPNAELSLNEKFDGSLVVVSCYDDEIVVTSKGGFDTWVVEKAKPLLTDAHKNMITTLDGYTFMFELLDPENPIVVQYDGPGLVLVGIRDKESGYHLPPEEIVCCGEKYGVPYTPVVGKMLAKDVPSMLSGCEGREGVVGYDGYLSIAKFKTEWYKEMHRCFSDISRSKVLSLFITGKLDDIYPTIPPAKKAMVDSIVKDAAAEIDKTTHEVKSFIESIDISSMSRKEYALYVLENGNPSLRHIYFMVYDGHPVDEAVYRYYLKKWSNER